VNPAPNTARKDANNLKINPITSSNIPQPTRIEHSGKENLTMLKKWCGQLYKILQDSSHPAHILYYVISGQGFWRELCLDRMCKMSAYCTYYSFYIKISHP